MKPTKLATLLLTLSMQVALADQDGYNSRMESLREIRERQSSNNSTYYTPERVYTDELRREINNDNIDRIQRDNQRAHDRAD